MKTKFEDEYILAKGYPGSEFNGKDIVVSMWRKSCGGKNNKIYIKYPSELLEDKIPKYELVLRKVKS